MKLYAWKPNGHGEFSWYVCAIDEATAFQAVTREVVRRLSIPALSGNPDRIDQYEAALWGTDYYRLTVAEPGCVLSNFND